MNLAQKWATEISPGFFWIIRPCWIQIFRPNSWFIRKNQGSKIDQNSVYGGYPPHTYGRWCVARMLYVTANANMLTRLCISMSFTRILWRDAPAPKEGHTAMGGLIVEASGRCRRSLIASLLKGYLRGPSTSTRGVIARGVIANFTSIFCIKKHEFSI